MAMVARRGRKSRRSELREKILLGARELFVSKGYEGVSMRELAKRLRYSPTAIYYHFADKDQLFQELCEWEFARLAKELQDSELIADPLERLRQIGRAYVRFGTECGSQNKMSVCVTHREQNYRGRDRAIESDAFALLKQTAKDAVATGHLRPELTDADLISQALWTAVHGAISLQVAGCNDSREASRAMANGVEAVLDLILQGFRSEPHLTSFDDQEISLAKTAGHDQCAAEAPCRS